jgi:hypothetical protein
MPGASKAVAAIMWPEGFDLRIQENSASDPRDYGMVEWKNRVLDAGFVAVTFKMKHRLLGEHQQTCFILGHLSDSEFEVKKKSGWSPVKTRARLLDISWLAIFRSDGLPTSSAKWIVYGNVLSSREARAAVLRPPEWHDLRTLIS